MKFSRTVFLSAAFAAMLDRISKIVINKKIKNGEEIEVVKDTLYITNVKNKGGFMGFLAKNPIILLISSINALVYTCCFYAEKLKKDKNSNALRIGFGFFLGGAIGNLFDRLYNKEVTDFVCFRTKKIKALPIFNVADFFIFLGFIITAIKMMLFDEE